MRLRQSSVAFPESALQSFDCTDDTVAPGTPAAARSPGRPRPSGLAAPGDGAVWQFFDCEFEDLPPDTPAVPRPEGRERRRLIAENGKGALPTAASDPATSTSRTNSEEAETPSRGTSPAQVGTSFRVRGLPAQIGTRLPLPGDPWKSLPPQPIMG